MTSSENLFSELTSTFSCPSTIGLRFCSIYPLIWEECVGINLSDIIKNMHSLELKAVTDIFNNIKKKLIKFARHSHYIFESRTTRDISTNLEAYPLIYLEVCLEFSNRSDPMYKQISKCVPNYFTPKIVSEFKLNEHFNTIRPYLETFHI